MSVPILVNLLASDPSKIIQPTVGFLKIAPDDRGEPRILISPDLKKIFMNRNGIAILISDKSALLIVTFDVGGAKVFIDNEDIPGFTDIMKARKFGGATIEQTAGGKGKITTTIGTDTGYFVGKKDLVTKGTWKMTYKLNVTAVGSQMSVFINDGEYSGNGAVEPSTLIVQIVMASNGNVFARYRPTPSTLLAIGAVMKTYGIGVDGEVTASIEKTATDFIMIFDGITRQIAISSVQSHTEEKTVHGECCNGTTVTVEFDDIEGIS